MVLRTIISLLLFTLALSAQGLDCAQCHEQSKALAKSAHSGVQCTGCHQGFTAVPHPQNARTLKCADCHAAAVRSYESGAHGIAARTGNQAAPDCAACHGAVHEVTPVNNAFRLTVPEMCGGCHPEPASQYLESIHGKAFIAGNFRSPSCTDCHGVHTIAPLSARSSLGSPRRIRETCASCHNDLLLAQRFRLPLDRVQSFDDTFHGLAAKAGNVTVANCASCHGVHLILPSSDPRSSVNRANLPKTCGKCHPGAGERFAIGTVHVVPGREPLPIRVVIGIYSVLIPGIVGYMALHHGGDLIRKLVRLRLRRTPAGPYPTANRAPAAEVRMHRFERIEHMLLIVSFAVLAWSGFALRYPDAWWAGPLDRWESVFPLRGTVHRVAAVIILIVAFMHAGSLVVDHNLRRHWKTLWPRRKDVPEAVLNTAYNLGLRKRKPVISSHSYIEKIEYWAVVWGTAVMALTGFFLWLNRYTLAWFPKLWLDVATSIHLYEAILATLAILVWHFYMVIFDPEVYPMDPAWIHGVSVRRRVREAHEEVDEAPRPEETEE